MRVMLITNLELANSAPNRRDNHLIDKLDKLLIVTIFNMSTGPQNFKMESQF